MAGSIALDSTAQSSFNKSIQNLIDNDKLRKGPSVAKPKKGVVYIRHIPHGFYEEQMTNYFGQFGAVTNVKLCRSKKSGKSKGFAFIEFAHAEVAEVVAETMNNYIMFNRLLKAEYIPYENIGGNKFWKTSATVKSFPRLRNRRKDILAKNAEKSEEKLGMLLRKRHHRVEGIIEKLDTFGISYTLRDFDAQPQVQPPTPVLEIDESDDEIEFKIRPNYTLKKRFLKKSKKSSSKKKKIELSEEVLNDSCRSPEPKLHLMDVKKNLFGDCGTSSSKADDSPKVRHANTISSLLCDDERRVSSGKSARKSAGEGKRKKSASRSLGPDDLILPAKRSSPKSVEPKSKKMAEKFSVRLQKKLTRRQQKDAGANKSPIDKLTKKLKNAGANKSPIDKLANKLKRASKRTSTKAANDGNRKKFSSKKLTIKGKLQGFGDLGM